MGARIELLAKGSIDTSIEGLISNFPIRVYNINDEHLTKKELESIKSLLADPIVEEVGVNHPVIQPPQNSTVIEVSPKPAVTDPHGKETKKVIEKIIGREIGGVSFSEQYVWKGELDDAKYENLKRDLGKVVINNFRRIDSSEWDPETGVGFYYPAVELPQEEPFEYINLEVSDKELLKISEEREISLNLEEMQSIQQQFRNPDFIEKRRDVNLEAMPTDAEMQALGQEWSEHCIHKKLKAKWYYTSEDPDDEADIPYETDNLFKSLIVNTTNKIMEKVDWIKSAFGDNSGIIKLNEKYNIAHKVETHNHPSTIEGFSGANTGTGGVLRDGSMSGVGMKVISSQYGFRVPHPDSYKDLPDSMQTPAQGLERIVSGVEDYGNKMGVPTQLGQVMIDDEWLKHAVYVGVVAVEKAERHGRPTHIKTVRPGYVALSLGGSVGKDGIHGATASSERLDSGAEEEEGLEQSVQIGDPITEKVMFDITETLMEKGYIKAAQDCGAGGWNSAVGEMAELCHDLEKKRHKIKTLFEKNNISSDSNVEERLKVAGEAIDLKKKASMFIDTLKYEIETGSIFEFESTGRGGALMDLTDAPEKYQGLKGWEKLVSESQERNVIIVKPENVEEIFELCEHYNAPVTEVAKFTDDGYYHVKDQRQSIVYLPLDFTGQALPQWEIKAHWKPPEIEEPELKEPEDLTQVMLELIGSPNLQSYEWISTRYDHEVQGMSRVKPLVGPGRGKSDAIAYTPILDEDEVVIESWGSNPWQGEIDGYHMGVNNVVTAVGRVIAMGGSLERISFNGNLTCPKPEKDPGIAATVLRTLKGAADSELAFNTPRKSGKDSTSMERDYVSTETGENVEVKAKTELLMSALGIIPDDSTLTTSDFKLPGDLIYIIGETKDELGASEYYKLRGEKGKNMPKSELANMKSRYENTQRVIQAGLVHSAQYIEKGGLYQALDNGSIGGDMGVDVVLDSIDDRVQRADKIMGSESAGRFLVTVHPSKKEEFEKEMESTYHQMIGTIRPDKEFRVEYQGETCILTEVDEIRTANKGEIRF